MEPMIARPAQPEEVAPSIVGNCLSLDEDSLNSLVARGLPVSEAEALAAMIDMPVETIGQELGEADLFRRQENGRLSEQASEQIIRCSRLYEHAAILFDGQDAAAQRWFAAPNATLGGVSPLASAGTAKGAEAADDLIGRLEHGVFA